MATFGKILEEIQDVDLARQRRSSSDVVRRQQIRALYDLTGRNVVVYYSAFLQRQGPQHYFVNQINDEDKHGIMASFAGLDFDQGLDLVLHTPGGDVAATESIIDYVRSKFGSNIRVIVPQICMSGGTMIALAGKAIIMGRHSNLGPIDPQLGGRPAIAILKEFERARNEIAADPRNAYLWQPILQQYFPTMLSHAQQSIEWATEIGKKTLIEGMFRGVHDAEKKADAVVNFLISHDLHKAHGRHLHRNELRAHGLVIEDLEIDAALQDAVLSVHHACMLTVGNHSVGKLIENHLGTTHAKITQMVIQTRAAPIAQPQPLPPPPAGGGPAPKAQTSIRPPFLERVKLAFKILLGRF